MAQGTELYRSPFVSGKDSSLCNNFETSEGPDSIP
jgi:hypothetical protein